MPQQFIPEGANLERPALPSTKFLEIHDPGLYRAVQDVLGALRQDILPPEVQEQLFRALNPSVQRQMISEVSGFDTGILVTFKQQLSLVDAILRRTFNDDGTLSNDAIGMDPKDVLNLSLKVSQMMVRELPKVYSMDRVQRMEQALYKVMASELSSAQQEKFLKELDNQKGNV